MRITHLDGLRGIAILWVIAYHAYSRWFDYTNLLSATKNISIFKYGFLGVSLFFMISGFVIFMTLDKSKNFIEFMKRRWLRLFPAMLIVSIIIYFTGFFFYERPLSHPTLINMIPGLTFISPTIFKITIGYRIEDLESSFWSLYVEVIFYFLIGIIYFFLNRKFCIPLLLLAFLGFYTSSFLQNPFVDNITNTIGLPHYGWFIIGCSLYEIVNNREKALNLTFAITAAITLIAIIFSHTHTDLTLVFYDILIIVLFVCSFYSHQLQDILSIKLLLIIGFASYPLYLIHEGMLVSSLIKLHNLGINDSVMYLMPILITLVLTAIAYCISKFIEPRIRNLLQKVI